MLPPGPVCSYQHEVTARGVCRTTALCPGSSTKMQQTQVASRAQVSAKQSKIIRASWVFITRVLKSKGFNYPLIAVSQQFWKFNNRRADLGWLQLPGEWHMWLLEGRLSQAEDAVSVWEGPRAGVGLMCRRTVRRSGSWVQSGHEEGGGQQR